MVDLSNIKIPPYDKVPGLTEAKVQRMIKTLEKDLTLLEQKKAEASK